MRNILLTITLALGIVCAKSQVNDLQVIATAGDYFVNTAKGVTMSWTLGEPIVATFTNTSANVMLTQGFQQGSSKEVGIPEQFATPFSVRIYPNPAKTEATLTILNAKEGRVILKLLDITGRTVISEEIEISSSEHKHTLNTSSLRSGVYLVTLTSGSTNNVVLKLIKE